VYRIYFMGLNIKRLPWTIPRDDIPLGILDDPDQKELELIAKDY